MRATANNQPSPESERVLVTPAEACALLSISDPTLREFVARGLLEQCYVGSHRRITYASVVALPGQLPVDNPAA